MATSVVMIPSNPANVGMWLEGPIGLGPKACEAAIVVGGMWEKRTVFECGGAAQWR